MDTERSLTLKKQIGKTIESETSWKLRTGTVLHYPQL
jgi:hypothetical protein